MREGFIQKHNTEATWKLKDDIDRSYILVTFASVRDKKWVTRMRKNANLQFRPHGAPISIREDATSEQVSVFRKALKTCNRLRRLKYCVFHKEGKIRVGRPPDHKWYRFDSPEVLAMLERNPEPGEQERRERDFQSGKL